MATFTENQHPLGPIVSEGPGYRSRDAITLTKGFKYKVGAVLGLMTLAGLSATAAAGGSNTGNGAMGAITVTKAKVGAWVLTITTAATNAGAFKLVDPDGVIYTGNVASAFTGGGLAFTLADGSTDFIVGDTFTLTVKGWSTANTGTGNGVLGTVTIGTAALPGAYVADFILAASNLGTFFVYDPNGKFLGQGVVGTAFTGGGVTFTIADGSSDFVVGDKVTLTIGSSVSEYRQVAQTATDGSVKAVAVLLVDTDTTAGSAKAAALTRACEVNQADLDFGTLDASGKTQAIADLASVGIIVRSAI